MLRFYLSIIAILLSLNCHGIDVSGKVTDRSGAPVIDAIVRFVDEKNVSYSYSTRTSNSGEYHIDEHSITYDQTAPAYNTFLFCYPNPFNRQTVISFHLDQKQRIDLSVYNVVGQKVRVISSGDLDQGHHQIVWDGLSQQGSPVAPGFYICSLQAKTNLSSIKMLVQGGDNIATPVWSSGEEQSHPKELTETSQIYNVTIQGNGFEDHHVYRVDMTNVSKKDFVIDRSVWTPFSTTGEYLGIYNGKDYTPFFIKGINLGSAVPGAWPGQLAISPEQYARWFRMMVDAGFNTLRVYTLHYPRFYKEFARYNIENPDKPLYLIQGVWLQERESDLNWNGSYDLTDLTAEFDKDIRDIVDCLHGKGKKSLECDDIYPRYGYACGDYDADGDGADVSQWLLGILIGREIYANEITETNKSKTATSAYKGAHLSISKASISEAWATERLDRLIKYERENYKTNRPVAFSSWPTLDPIDHPSEPDGSMEDEEELDLNKIELTNAPGGFFISYHIYSYFPNFISRDEKYRNVKDELGLNPYLGYLRDLREHYTRHPVLVAEFGVPTSWGIARYSQSGMHHGGLNEEEHGKYTMRMFRNIYETRYCGGIAFSWMDEWFKSTWITHPLSSINRRLWHNVTSPENNYGLIHFVPNPEYYVQKHTQNYNFEKISKASVWQDFAFFNMDMTLKSPLTKGDTLWIAIDTYKRDMGESTLPNRKNVLKNRAEFLVKITTDSALLYVTKAYNLQGISQMSSPSLAFQTKKTDGEPWMLCRWQSDELYNYPNTQDIGKLNICRENEKLGIHHAVQIRPNGIYVRIPWTLLQFSDPSNSMVIDDGSFESISRCRNYWACKWQYLKSIRSEGIAVTMVYKNEVAEQTPYTWSDWDVNSRDVLNPKMFVEEEKASLSVIREGLKKIPYTP